MADKYDDDLADIKPIKPGTIMADWFENGIRAIVMRGPGSYCAYLGVPSDHPLAGFHYDSIPLDCHGGLTFASEGQDHFPEGFYWYGWDYNHAGDRAALHYDTYIPSLETGKSWSLGEVKAETHQVIYDFGRLVKLAERIKAK